MRLFRCVLTTAALALLLGCGSGSTSDSPSSPSAPGNSSGSSISIVSGASVLTNTAYAPNPIAIAAGGSVTWRNNDNTTHTSTSDNGAWNSGSIAPGASFSHTFAAAGTYTYHCTIHPGMVGIVTVQ